MCATHIFLQNSVILYLTTIYLGSNVFRFTASATFLPGFGKTKFGHLTGLDEYLAPAALTVFLLVVALLLVTFVLDESDCTHIGKINLPCMAKKTF